MKRLIKKTHFDNVNAIRFLTLFAIFFAHCFITDNQQIKVSSLFLDLRQVSANLNTAAYSFLFILTGFLNTWNIFEERFIYKKVNVLRFYMRRFLTLLPLYFVLFFIGNYIIPYLGVGNNYHAVNVFSPLRYFTFTFNFGYIETWNVFEGIIGNMWSVAAIIQILLLWPLLMGFFRRNEVFLYLLIFIAFVVFAWFFKAEPSRMNKEGLTDYNAFTFNTFRVLFDFMIGSYIAYFSFFKYETYSFLKKTTKRLIGGIYLAFFAYMIFSNRILFNLSSQFPSALLFLADKIVVSVCLGFFLFEQNYSSNSIFKLAKLKFLKVTELYMYGIYCFLPIGAFCGFKLMTFISDDQTMPMVLIVQPILGFFVTIVLAVISYEFIEKSFIKLKKEYQPTREYAPTLGPDVKT